MSDASRNVASHPGRTLPRRPRAASVGSATSVAFARSPIVIDARVANPLRTGPGADAMTSTSQWLELQSKGLREGLHVGFRAA